MNLGEGPDTAYETSKSDDDILMHSIWVNENDEPFQLME